MRLIPITAAETAEQTSVCAGCSLRELCLPLGLSAEELDDAGEMVAYRQAVARGEALFRHGDTFHSVFAVRTGFFKTRTVGADGHEWITGFRMSGDLVGLEGLGDDRHLGDALALEDSQVCVIPYPPLMALLRDSPPLQRQFHRLLAREIARDHPERLPGRLRADTRVAAFLLDLAERLQARGFSGSSFVLRMTRAEIGSFLGLTLETVSRAFSAFQSKGWIEVNQRDIRIVDPEALAVTVRAEVPC